MRLGEIVINRDSTFKISEGPYIGSWVLVCRNDKPPVGEAWILTPVCPPEIPGGL